MVTYAPGVIARQNAQAQHERLNAALKTQCDMVDVPMEWHSKQTTKAVLFPTYGWVPKVAIRWRRKDGMILPWDSGHADDQLMISAEFVK